MASLQKAMALSYRLNSYIMFKQVLMSPRVVIPENSEGVSLGAEGVRFSAGAPEPRGWWQPPRWTPRNAPASRTHVALLLDRGSAYPNTLGLVADPGSRQAYGRTHVILWDVHGGAPTANRKRAAFLGKVDPEARNDADAFSEGEAHWCYLARTTLS